MSLWKMSSIDFVNRVHNIVNEAYQNVRNSWNNVKFIQESMKTNDTIDDRLKKENNDIILANALNEHHRLVKTHEFLSNYYTTVLTRYMAKTSI